MASTPTPFPRTRRGLIVEDQADTRAWLVRMLGMAFDGIAISEAATFQAARDWITAQPRTFAEPDASAARDIALIDIGLPDGNGIDLIRMLADGHPRILPVVSPERTIGHACGPWVLVAAGSKQLWCVAIGNSTRIEWL